MNGLRILIHKEAKDSFVATCLDHYLVASAKTLADVAKEMEVMLATHIQHSKEVGQKPFRHLASAPKGAHLLWGKSVTKSLPRFGYISAELQYRVYTGDPARQDPLLVSS